MRTFSLVVRRTHMYLALFLVPWMAMYAASTMAMNHREHLASQGAAPRAYHLVEELPYEMSWAEGATPADMAEQILRDLGLEGRHGVQTQDGGQKIVIVRNAPIGNRRITYAAADNKLVIEQEEYHGTAFLERFHRRRGYDTPYTLETAWSASVDLVIVAMIFWVASGLWLWWELKITRVWGGVAIVAGLAIFVAFLTTI